MTESPDRLARLQSYLAGDPDNPALLADAVQAAIDGGELDKAEAWNARLGEIAPLGFESRYLGSVIAMRRSDFAAAARLLEGLLPDHPHANVRFNLAWSRAMLGDKTGARELLDAGTTAVIGAAAMLKTQLMHEAGEFDEAMAFGRGALRDHPEDRGLLAALATLALDVEDAAFAAECAGKAGDHPEAHAVTAVLELQAGDPDQARLSFDRSIAQRRHNPRAWVGRGLTALARQDAASAASDIDTGAQQFGDHIGSWIAAGWAHFLAGDQAAARQRFDRAMGLDPNFAESHGSLAVLAAVAGDREAARRGMATALRLDRQCFSAALAQVLLSNDDPAKAAAIVERAMNTPLGEQGLTMASFMAGMTKPTVH